MTRERVLDISRRYYIPSPGSTLILGECKEFVKAYCIERGRTAYLEEFLESIFSYSNIYESGLKWNYYFEYALGYYMVKFQINILMDLSNNKILLIF